jgi:hypothetical protein
MDPGALRRPRTGALAACTSLIASCENGTTRHRDSIDSTQLNQNRQDQEIQKNFQRALPHLSPTRA